MSNIETTGIIEQRRNMEELLMSNPQMEKKIQRIIRIVLTEAKKDMELVAQASMKSSPRQAYKAVKTSVYRRILGGNMSILDRKKTSGTTNYEPPRKLRPGQRGGNRVPRGERTERALKYDPEQQAYVLRILNKGTDDRMAGTRGGRLHGNRGSIAPREFFSSNSRNIISKAAGKLDALIDEVIKNEMK